MFTKLIIDLLVLAHSKWYCLIHSTNIMQSSGQIAQGRWKHGIYQIPIYSILFAWKIKKLIDFFLIMFCVQENEANTGWHGVSYEKWSLYIILAEIFVWKVYAWKLNDHWKLEIQPDP